MQNEFQLPSLSRSLANPIYSTEYLNNLIRCFLSSFIFASFSRLECTVRGHFSLPSPLSFILPSATVSTTDLTWVWSKARLISFNPKSSIFQMMAVSTQNVNGPRDGEVKMTRFVKAMVDALCGSLKIIDKVRDNNIISIYGSLYSLISLVFYLSSSDCG